MDREEAIKLVKRIKGAMVYTEEEKEALETLIPELRESEDERVRKKLINIVGLYYGTSTVDPERDECIAYLEKQKEEEGYEAVPVESTLEYKLGFKAGKESEKQKEQKPEEWNYPYGVDETVDRLVSLAECLEMDGDCLFNEYSGTEYGKFLRELARKQVECEPAEWSEEDEVKLNDVIRMIENSGNVKSIIKHYTDFLKSLPQRFNLQPKQEWSKEDENKIERLAFLVSVVAEKEMISPEECIDLRRFVKSYHPQSKQEWSEEDEKNIGSIVARLDSILDCSNATEAIKITKEIAWLKSRRPQKLDASKLENFDPAEVLDRIKREWPMAWEKVVGKQEWSEEDEKIRQSIIKDIEFERNYTYATTGKSSEKYNEQINWLKVLSLNRKKINEDVEKLCSNEWSEEDERIMNGIQLVLESWDRTHSSLSGLPSLIPSYISWLKSRRSQPKQKRQIKEGDKVSIHCRKDRKEGIITIYDGKVGEVIHVWDAKRNPWGHIGVRLDNGCNHGFYEDELEVLDELSWKPSEVCYGAKGDPDPAGSPSEERMNAPKRTYWL